MPKSESQRRSAEKYLKENVDTIAVRVKKGQKEAIKSHATKQGESLNSFVNRSIGETMARDTATLVSEGKKKKQ
jgi:predicted HicB family RNase H-like nuclease